MSTLAPQLSIIIVNWNTKDLLDACLSSIISATSEITLELIIVDNGSTDGSVALVETKYAHAILIQNSQNRGFAVANNLGISIAKGEYLLLLNSDTEVKPEALYKLKNLLDTQATVGIVGADLRNPDNSEQVCFGEVPYPPSKILEKFLRTLFKSNPRAVSQQTSSSSTIRQPVEVGWVLGAALMIRRSVIDKIGMLDERFFMYAEEIDLCYRTQHAGWKVMYVPEACVMHVNGGSSHKSPELQSKLFRMRQRSLEMFYRKHYGFVASQLLRIIHLKQRIIHS